MANRWMSAMLGIKPNGVLAVCGRLPRQGSRTSVPPLQGGGELPGDFFLGLRSALHPRLSQDGLSALRLQAETADELDALLPAVLDRVFKGEL
jgi:hypothetical protein